MHDTRIAVVLPAAGLGKRFGAGATPKVETPLSGKPMFAWSVALFARGPNLGDVVLAVHPDRLADFRFAHGDALGLSGVSVVAGGTLERWETVAKALDHVSEGHTHVAVHDAARPLASRELIDRVFAAADRYDAVLPAVPVADTLKRVVEVPPERRPGDAIDAILGGAAATAPRSQRVVGTLDRRGLVGVQTPQVFRLDLLRRAYDAVRRGEIDAASITDDAGLVEALGETVHVVEGESTNFKITRAGDAELAEALLQRRAAAGARIDAERRLFPDDDEEEG